MERIRTLKYKGKRHLPLPTGLYTVGCTDIMTSYLKSGVFVRLYYPSAECGILERYLQWPQWIPNKEYIDGYAARAGVRPSVYQIFSKLFIGKVFIPAIWQATLSQEEEKYPIIIFSHGLSGWRTSYSTICMELVSHGFIVAAVEHRDYSASASFYKKQARMSENGEHPGSCLHELDKLLNIPVDSEWKDAVDGRWEPGPKQQSIGPYSHAKEWMYYLPTTKENEQSVRSQQLKKRSLECIEALDLLEDLNLGKCVTNVLDASFRAEMFKGCLDMSKAFIIGHSFGGATALLSLATELRFRAGIILDPWMFPFFEDKSSFALISQPFMILNIESFQTKESLVVMKDLQNPHAEREFITMKKAQHRDLCDVPFASRPSCSLSAKLGLRIEKFSALDLATHLMLKFLGRHLGISLAIESSRVKSLTKKYLKEELFQF